MLVVVGHQTTKQDTLLVVLGQDVMVLYHKEQVEPPILVMVEAEVLALLVMVVLVVQVF